MSDLTKGQQIAAMIMPFITMGIENTVQAHKEVQETIAKTIDMNVVPSPAQLAEVAIKFAVWLQYKDIKPFTDARGAHFYGLQKNYDSEEIFELFKKENNL